ncbi:MAG: glutamine amidotransferase-related protein, partial [Phycisphaerae bacterium]
DAARYHSLVIRPGTLPDDFMVTAWTAEKEIMAVQHKLWPLYGVQFHPESFLTPDGYTLLTNFLKIQAPAPVPTSS